MLWRTDRTGAGVVVSADGASVSRDSREGWGCQLADQWLSKDITTLVLDWDVLEGEAWVGVVGRVRTAGSSSVSC